MPCGLVSPLRCFIAMLFPRFDLVALHGQNTNVWHAYQSLRLQLVSIEDGLADKYISRELYQRFRQHVLAQTVSAQEQTIISTLQQVELDLLAGKRLDYESLMRLVDIIRKNTTDFPEWQTSSTADYYRQSSFQNQKKSSGYWW